MHQSVSICVIGSGYVGLVASVCFAEMGHRVICVDNDQERIRTLCAGGVPIFEKHLPELLQKHGGHSILFTDDLAASVECCEAIFIAVGTPQGENGAADLSYVEAVVSEIAISINNYKVIVEKSTVPVHTSEWISRALCRHGVASNLFDVVSNPEFLREGTAVSDFLHPDRIVVGVSSQRASSIMKRIYQPLTEGEYYLHAHAISGSCNACSPAKLLITSPQSAELIKHASNAFLALKVSFINAVANMAEAADADVEDIAVGMGLDGRIGTRFLKAGLGYGGSCFPKDVAAFHWVARQHGVEIPLLRDISKINEEQRELFFEKVVSVLWTLRGKRLAVLGLSYKGGTDDIRESPAIYIVQRLLEAGARVVAYDPAALERSKQVLPPSEQMIYATNLYEATDGADAVLILTDWKEFAAIDFEKLKRSVRFPIIIDGRNFYAPQEMAEIGFTYVSIGRAVVQPMPRERYAVA